MAVVLLLFWTWASKVSVAEDGVLLYFHTFGRRDYR
jgi:hypothetical protein